MLHLYPFSIATTMVIALPNFSIVSLLLCVAHVTPVWQRTLTHFLSNSLMQELTDIPNPLFMQPVNSGTLSLCQYFLLSMTSSLLNAMYPGTSMETSKKFGLDFGFLCFVFHTERATLQANVAFSSLLTA